MKHRWFFPILRHYGFRHWYHHTDNGQIFTLWLLFASIGVII